MHDVKCIQLLTVGVSLSVRWCVAAEYVVFRLQEEVELMEDEMRRREGGSEVETDSEMERALYVAYMCTKPIALQCHNIVYTGSMCTKPKALHTLVVVS